MDKVLLTLAALILFSSCGRTHTPEPPQWTVPDEFQALTEDFVAQAQAHGITIQRNLVVRKTENLPSASYVGYCTYPDNDHSYPLVEIRTSYWDSASVNADDRKALLFHELGHCLLFRGHSNATAFAPNLGTTIPLSLMWPYILPSYRGNIYAFYQANEAAYLRELFDPNQVGSIQSLVLAAAQTGTPNSVEQIDTANLQLEVSGFSALDASGRCTDHVHQLAP